MKILLMQSIFWTIHYLDWTWLPFDMVQGRLFLSIQIVVHLSVIIKIYNFMNFIRNEIINEVLLLFKSVLERNMTYHRQSSDNWHFPSA